MVPPRILYPGLWIKAPVAGWYLTFDDGPTPEITEAVLKLLDQYQIKASFFLSGAQIKKHPAFVSLYAKHGHTIGFHGHEHENGFWKSNKWLQQNFTLPPGLESVRFFRAPYGRLWPWQYSNLRCMGQWVHWSFMAGDFYPLKHPGAQSASFKKRLAQTSENEIFVFHDSIKARHHLMWMLQEVIETGIKKGVTFRVLS